MGQAAAEQCWRKMGGGLRTSHSKKDRCGPARPTHQRTGRPLCPAAPRRRAIRQPPPTAPLYVTLLDELGSSVRGPTRHPLSW